MTVEPCQRGQEIGHFTPPPFKLRKKAGLGLLQAAQAIFRCRDFGLARLDARGGDDQPGTDLIGFLADGVGLGVERLLAFDAGVELMLQVFERRRVGRFGSRAGRA
ncbi:MAG: hypothetical protein P4L72_13015 [Parvibaculum sp.]|uniref:hypothetical protein n=1 Tax=Parvibaculum sp. TaxID=2024848 RepID=UPI00283C587A|nr:hypothetical protein [Parvibaculum sp.]MDR3500134.1 hypothetical protein [Parvibaculum sp.]